MGGLTDPAAKGWRRIATVGPIELYHCRSSKYGWHTMVVRLRDATAPRRSWKMNWSSLEQRLAVDTPANDLATNHPQYFKQVMIQLRNWTPQPQR
jgi:hypothetical protein